MQHLLICDDSDLNWLDLCIPKDWLVLLMEMSMLKAVFIARIELIAVKRS